MDARTADANDRPTALHDVRRYLDSSPSPFHAAATTTDRLRQARFVELDLADDWSSLPSSGYVVDGGAVVAWRVGPGVSEHSPFRLAGAHTDSPCLRVKPNPDHDAAGWRQLNVEVYGGILNNSWLDRDLAIAGRIVTADGLATLFDSERPVARVPQLAVHLDRGVNDGLTLDPQQHLRPVWGVGPSNRDEFAQWLANESGVTQPEFWDLCLYDAQPAAVLGVDASMLASGRLDNLLSCWASTTALIDADPTDVIAAIVLNDHEEVGSASTTGAEGPLLERVLERHVGARGGTRTDFLRALSGSTCVSADNAHAVHPNYPERHDPDHRPMVNAGPAIKVNSNQRYATSPTTAASFRAACREAGVPSQIFVSRNNVPCGSTIGPITATRLGIATVDVGIPQLSMHSARELCGVDDPAWLASALTVTLSR